MISPRLRLIPLLCALLVVLLVAGAAHACPNCKEALAANDPQQSGVVRGYFYSILFMMGMPFAFIGCFSVYMYRQVQKSRAQRVSPNEHGEHREPSS